MEIINRDVLVLRPHLFYEEASLLVNLMPYYEVEHSVPKAGVLLESTRLV
jgi:hypothetical protein